MPDENACRPTKRYIVTNERGEEFLLPKYAATFRILMDDKETIRDVLNSLLQLDHEHEITELEYEFLFNLRDQTLLFLTGRSVSFLHHSALESVAAAMPANTRNPVWKTAFFTSVP